MRQSKQSRLANFLSNGNVATASQMRSRFGYSSTSGVRKAITRLRRSGVSVSASSHTLRDGRTVNRYSVQKRSRKTV